MPRSMFDQTLVAPAGRSARGGTVFMSLVIHTAGLAVLVGWQFASAFQDLSITRPLTLFVAARDLPIPPAPAMPRTAVQASPAVAPTAAPDAITPEAPAAHAPVDVGAPTLGGTVCGAVCGPGVPGGVGIAGAAPTLVAPPPPSAPPAEVLRVGGNIKPPERIVYVPPVYPPIAMTARVEGAVILEATIDEQGRVRDLKVLRSVPLLDQAAIDAVGRWRYTATRLNGVAVPVVMSVTVRFSLR